MMIKGKAKLEFGTGDIRMTSCLGNGIGAVCCVTHAPQVIGSAMTVEDDWSPSNSEVILTFTKVESIDVLIKKLNETKQYMLGNVPNNVKYIDGPLDFDAFLKDVVEYYGK